MISFLTKVFRGLGGEIVIPDTGNDGGFSFDGEPLEFNGQRLAFA